jgi:hypothetical protein
MGCAVSVVLTSGPIDRVVKDASGAATEKSLRRARSRRRADARVNDVAQALAEPQVDAPRRARRDRARGSARSARWPRRSAWATRRSAPAARALPPNGSSPASAASRPSGCELADAGVLGDVPATRPPRVGACNRTRQPGRRACSFVSSDPCSGTPGDGVPDHPRESHSRSTRGASRAGSDAMDHPRRERGPRRRRQALACSFASSDPR